MRIAPKIELSADERRTLESWARGRCAPVRHQQRAMIILAAAEGKQNKQISEEFDIDVTVVGRWRKRFHERRIEGIERDAPGRGRKPDTALASRVIEMTTTKRPDNATHWSTKSMARAAGTSPSTVQRIWAAAGLKPHLVKNFKSSNDSEFEPKMTDVVGLYTNPPEHALVFGCDEKSQIQALDRTQLGLPLARGRPATQTHDYIRNGTTTLFAALNAADGSVIGTCMKRHRHQEWIRFLRLIDKSTPPDKQLHLIVDNYATHKHPAVRAWLRRHPRYHIHFTPTSASWLNIVERFFRDITANRIRRGTFRSVNELTDAIDEYMAMHNASPKPIIWTAKACDILEKVRRARAKLDKLRTK